MAALSNKNGVVGNTGRKIPSIPRPNEIQPNIVSNHFISGCKINVYFLPGTGRKLPYRSGRALKG